MSRTRLPIVSKWRHGRRMEQGFTTAWRSSSRSKTAQFVRPHRRLCIFAAGGACRSAARDDEELDPPRPAKLEEVPGSMTERELLAAEMALRVLEGQEQLDAQNLLQSDPAFAAEVADWEARLAPLIAEIGSVRPDSAMWERIRKAIGSDPANVISLKRKLRLWQIGGIAAAAAACLYSSSPRIANGWLRRRSMQALRSWLPRLHRRRSRRPWPSPICRARGP